jgi:hypothetical protein
MIAHGLNRLGGLIARGLNAVLSLLLVAPSAERTSVVGPEPRTARVDVETRGSAASELRAAIVCDLAPPIAPSRARPAVVEIERRLIVVATDSRSAIAESDVVAVVDPETRHTAIAREDRAITTTSEPRRAAA